MRLDERLLEDYRRTFELLQRLGFNELVIWGQRFDPGECGTISLDPCDE